MKLAVKRQMPKIVIRNEAMSPKLAPGKVGDHEGYLALGLPGSMEEKVADGAYVCGVR